MPQPKLSQLGGIYVAFFVMPQRVATIAIPRKYSTSDIMKPQRDMAGPK